MCYTQIHLIETKCTGSKLTFSESSFDILTRIRFCLAQNLLNISVSTLIND